MAASRSKDMMVPSTVKRCRAALNTETSTEPEGITRRMVLNVLEAFFRRPWLHLLPLILMLALGASTVAGMKQVYRSVGTFSVTNESLLSDLTAAGNQPGFSFESPAAVTSRQINELLRTEDFLDQIATTAGITTDDGAGALLRTQIRASVGAASDGDSLVRVFAATGDPDTTFRLADATMTSYKDFVVTSSTDQSTSTEAFLQTHADEAEAQLTSAQDALDQFLLQNPAASDEERSLTEQLQINRLQAVVDRAETQYELAQTALDTARLATAQANTVVEQRLKVVDEPEAPFAPEPRLRKAAMTMIVFGVLGVLLSLALVIVTAALDRTIRLPRDITSRFGIDVLAVVPEARR